MLQILDYRILFDDFELKKKVDFDATKDVSVTNLTRFIIHDNIN